MSAIANQVAGGTSGAFGLVISAPTGESLASRRLALARLQNRSGDQVQRRPGFDRNVDYKNLLASPAINTPKMVDSVVTPKVA